MHVASLFVAVYAVLSTLAAPVPGAETRNLHKSPNSCQSPSENRLLPTPDRHSPLLLPLTSNDSARGLLSPLQQDETHLPATSYVSPRATGIKHPTPGHATTHPSTGHGNVPDVAEIEKHLHVEPNKSLFYSGPGGYQKVAAARAEAMGLKILDMSWKDYKGIEQGSAYTKISTEGRPKPVQGRFWDNASKAFAQLSSGTVHVLLPADVHGPDNFFKQSVWARIEWKALIDNPRVTEVIMINPDNKAEKRPLFVRDASGKNVITGGKTKL